MILYADRGCPFARRVIAFTQHLGVVLEVRESDATRAMRPSVAGLRSTQLPVLLDDGLLVTESRVMLEHLAERFAFPTSFPADLAGRTLDRRAMAVVDDFFVPALFRGTSDQLDEARLEDGVSALIAAIGSGVRPLRLVSFHVAPIAAAFRAWHPEHPITQRFSVCAALREFVDDALASAAFGDSAIAPHDYAQLYRTVRQQGLLPVE